jgi:hypothetical protein
MLFLALALDIRDRLQGRIPPSAKRSGQWPTVRKHHLEAHPFCAVCGGTKFLEVHHVDDFHNHPELELDPGNLITLCEHPAHNDHLIFGHLGSFKSINIDIVKDALIWYNKITKRP